MMDPNFDIVPTLRMFDGLMMNKAADEIESLRLEVARLSANVAQGAEPYYRWVGGTCFMYWENQNGELQCKEIAAPPAPRPWNCFQGDKQPLTDHRIWEIADLVWQRKSITTDRGFELDFAHEVIAAALHEVCAASTSASKPALTFEELASRFKLEEKLSDVGAYGYDRTMMRDLARDFFNACTVAASTPANVARLSMDDLQGKALAHGFKYWRAPDAHGVTGTIKQAEDLIADLIGVEVEIISAAPTSSGRCFFCGEPMDGTHEQDCPKANASANVAQGAEAVSDDHAAVLWRLARMTGAIAWTAELRKAIALPAQPSTTDDARDAIRHAALEEACAAIKAEDDRQSSNDYMLDSDDCIAVIRALTAAQSASGDTK